MKSLLLRFWQWLGRLLGQQTSAADTTPVAQPPAPPAAQSSLAAPPPPAVTLPPPPPPQLDLHTTEGAQFGRKASIVTQPEGRLYRSLLLAVDGEYTVMAKVRLWDFVWLVNEPPERKQHLSRLSCRHVDFLLCDPGNLKPLLVIELDDYSHKKPEAVAADRYKNELFAAAGLPILRLNHPNHPPRRLRELIAAAVGQ